MQVLKDAQEPVDDLSSNVSSVVKLENIKNVAVDLSAIGDASKIEEAFQTSQTALQDCFEQRFRLAFETAGSSVQQVLDSPEGARLLDLIEWQKLANDVDNVRLAWRSCEDLAVETHGIAVGWDQRLEGVATGWIYELHERIKQMLEKVQEPAEAQDSCPEARPLITPCLFCCLRAFSLYLAKHGLLGFAGFAGVAGCQVCKLSAQVGLAGTSCKNLFGAMLTLAESLSDASRKTCEEAARSNSCHVSHEGVPHHCKAENLRRDFGLLPTWRN